MAVMPTDPNSPTYACDMAAWLRERYVELVAGGSEKVIRYRGPNGEREVQFTAANLGIMQAEITKWESLCLNNGVKVPQRFAIRGGVRRTGGGFYGD